MKTAFFNGPGPAGNTDMVGQVYGDRRQLIAEISDLYPVMITPDNFEEHVENLQDLEALFTTWSMVHLTGGQIDRLPNLKALFHAGGSVKHFGIPSDFLIYRVNAKSLQPPLVSVFGAVLF